MQSCSHGEATTSRHLQCRYDGVELGWTHLPEGRALQRHPALRQYAALLGNEGNIRIEGIRGFEESRVGTRKDENTREGENKRESEKRKSGGKGEKV